MKEETLQIIEIFNSIQGEGSHTGEPSTFIRTAGCNLAGKGVCKNCFGIVKGRRIPQIISSDGINKKICDIKKGDKLITFDSNSNLVETYVTELHQRVVNSWYRITINGIQYFITGEHPFFTTRGLIEARNLQIGDMIIHLSWHDKLSFIKMGDKNPMKDKGVIAKKLASHDYEASGKKLSETIKKQIEEGNYINPWYKLSEEKQNELKKFYSERMKGDKNPNYKGTKKNYNELREQINSKIATKCSWCDNENGILVVHHKDGNIQNDLKDNLIIVCMNCLKKGNLNPNYNGNRDNYNKLRKQINLGLITECSWCDKKNRLLIVHHKDGNQQNDSENNLVIICRSCHDIHHGHGYNFWLNDRKDGKIMKVKPHYPAINGLEVQAIKYFDRNNYPPSTKPKPLIVYNISCEPYNSYLIDWMWVHNCDSPYSWGDGTTMTIEEIITEVEKYPTKNIVITGGEPTIQEHGWILCYRLRNKNFIVSVQTNGTAINGLTGLCNHLLMDMKPGMSDLELIAMLDPERDEVKVLVGDPDDLEFAHKVNRLASENNILTIIQVKNDYKNDDRYELIERYKWLVTQEFLEPVRILPQLHTLIWGNKRGV